MIHTTNSSLDDSNKTQTWNMLGENNLSFNWKDAKININTKIDNIQLVIKTHLANGENSYSLIYFFGKGDLSLIEAQDQSPRILDSMVKYNGKTVSFVTTIKKPRVWGKGNPNTNLYWIDDYLVSIDAETFKKIKGRKVRITDTIRYSTGILSPRFPRLYSATGNIIATQGWGKDAKRLINPRIEILKKNQFQ